MNWDHIKAVMGRWKQTAKAGEQVLLTNGHIAVAVPHDSPLIEMAVEYPKLAELWEGASKVPVEPQPMGELCEERGYHYRRIGSHLLAERYVRCFDGPGITWTQSKDHGLAHAEGKLIAIVMRCKPGTETVCENQNLPDSEIFSPYASEDNDWYLVNEATLRTGIEKAEDKRNAAESKRDELETEIEEWNAEIASLQLRLTRLAAGVK